MKSEKFMPPEISIITPVWNGLPYLVKCIDSVLEQKFENWELLISDNLSTDGTRAYLESLSDPRIRVFKQTKNLGIMGNVNFLFARATAEISQILCADDYFTSSESLQTIVTYWRSAHKDIGFVRFNHDYVTKSKIIELENKIAPEVIPSNKASLWFFTFGNIAGNLSDVSVRTSLIEETGWFNEGLPMAGDFDFWRRAAKRTAVGVKKDNVVHVRRHEMVASNYLSLKGELYAQHILIYEELIGELSPGIDRKILIDYFNFEICSFHLRNALKLVIKGRFQYLKAILNAKSPILWPKWRQLIWCFPYIMLNGHQKLTYKMAKAIIAK